MKFMKIALSVVAIAAIATIYGTGAFVSQTHGMDNTVDGFLVISNAEMAQQVGGQFVNQKEGKQEIIPGEDYSKHCDGLNDCLRPNMNRKEFIRDYYVCDHCPPPVNIYNLIPINFFNRDFHWPKYSRFKEDGITRYKVPKIVIVNCKFTDDGECKVSPDIHENGPKKNSCERLVGFCD